MMPYDAYRLYQVERAKSSTGVQRADEQVGQLAAAASWLFRGITQPARAPCGGRTRPRRAACPARQNRLTAGAR